MKNLKIYDNGAGSFDRITAIDTEPLATVARINANGTLKKFNSFHCVGASETGAGFYQHEELEKQFVGRHLGKRVKFQDLTPELQNRLRNDYDHLANIYNGKEQLKAVVLIGGLHYTLDVITYGRDKQPDCKVSSFVLNIYFRTPSGVNRKKYSSVAKLRSEVERKIRQTLELDKDSEIEFYLSDNVSII